MSIKKYTGAAMALVMVTSNAAQIVQAQAAEDKVNEYDQQQDQGQQELSLDYSSNKDMDFIEGVEPKTEDTDDIINVKDESEEDEIADSEEKISEENDSQENDTTEENQENLDNEESQESVEENTEDIDYEENVNDDNNQLEISEIPTTVHKGDGLEEVQEIELSPEEMEKIPAYNPDEHIELYNASSNGLNYSTTRGRDSLGSLSNGTMLQNGYDLIYGYLEKIHNGSIEPKVTVNGTSCLLEKIDLASLGNVSLADLKKIYLTVNYDHPELFWVGKSYAYELTNGKISNISLEIQSNYKDSKSIQVSKRNLDNAVSEYFASAAGCTSDYDIEKAFHDKMIKDAVYDPYVNSTSYININSHNVLGILVDKVGVCESYAKAMQLLLNAKGIDNLYITGTGNGGGHAWNQVKINGVYCNLDTTWDDLDYIENGGVQYNYFNVPDSDFTSAHIANGPSASTGTREYLYAAEKCTSSEYTWFNQNKENVFAASDVNDAEKKKAYIISQVKSCLENDDYTIPITGENYSTASSLLSYFNSNYSDILFGDELMVLFQSKCQLSFGYTKLNSGNRQFSINLIPLSPVKAESITMPDKLTITTLKNSKYLTPIVLPDNTTETITWTSSNSSIAMMDSSKKGVIVPLKKGTAIVTAKIGDVSAQCEVTVCDPVYTDKDQLQELYDDNKDRIEDSYTDDSWSVFKIALDNAKAVLDNESASQSDVDNAASALENAVSSLAELGNKTELQKLYDDNKDKTASSYTSTTWSAFDDAMKAAKTVLDNSGAVQSEIDKAETDLETAISKLVEVGNKTELQKLYDDNKDKISSSYTSTSWSAFNNAMKAAKTVLDNSDAVQSQVDKAETDLETAISSLVEVGNKTALQKLYDDNKDKISSSYTSTSWPEFNNAMKAAKTVLDNTNAVQSQVDKAETDLETAISSLVEVGDKTALQKLYDDNKNKVQSSYVSTTWKDFAQALNNAKKVLDNADALQSEIDKAESELEDAISNLTVKGDKTELEKLYNDNKNKTQGNYTNSSWNEFKSALNDAKSVIDNSDAVQSEINDAKIKLQSALNKLIGKVDTALLQQLYDDNKDKTRDGYTSDGWDEFVSALDYAKSVLDKEEPSDSEVAEAEIKLSCAAESLVKKADKTVLKKLYDTNKTKSELSYTSASWTGFAKAMKDVETVLNNEEAVQSEADEAKTKLQDAVNALVKTADKTALEKLYNDNSSRDESSYTSASWTGFAEAMEDAKSVLDNRDTVQSEADAAKTKLQSAISKLILRGNKTELQNLYDDNKSKAEELYTSSSWADFDEAMKNAQTVLDNKDAVQSTINNAVTILKNGVKGLILRGDKTELQNLYDTNKSKSEEDYISSTWTGFEKAMANAQAILNDKDALQSAINKAKNDLETAAGKLSLRGTKEDLQKLYDDNKNRKSSVYTSTTWSSFTKALAAAKTVLDNKDALQNSIDTAKVNLENAVKDLAERGDKDELIALYNANKNKNSVDYSSRSYNNFKTSLNNAAKVLNNNDALQDEIDSAKSSLENSINALVDISKLKSLYNSNKDKKQSNYTDTSWTTFTKALSQAKTALNNSNISQAQADSAELSLQNAVNGLKLKADKTNLQSLYNSNKNRNVNKYSAESWAPFKTALNNAAAILNKDEAVQSEVDLAVSNLKSAVGALVEITDKTYLQSLYNANKDKTQGKYSDTKWAAFTNALANAKTILDKADAAQTETDEAYNALKKAVSNLGSGSSGGHSGGSSGGGSSSSDSDKDDGDSTIYKTYKKITITVNGKTIVDTEDETESNDKTSLDDTIEDTLKKMVDELKDNTEFNLESLVSDIHKFKNDDFDLDLARFKKAAEDCMYIHCNKVSSEDDKVNIGGSFGDSSKYIYIVDKITKKLINADYLNEEDAKEIKSDSIRMKMKNGYEYLVTDSPMNSLKDNSWNNVDGKWMYVKDAAVKSGWLKSQDNNWYYSDNKGIMQTGWLKDINDKWYNLSDSGTMNTGWFKDKDGIWYYLNADGSMKKGWHQDSNGKWYYLGESGAMKTGWFKDNDGKWYYLNSDGSMAVDTVVNGYLLGSNGAWIIE